MKAIHFVLAGLTLALAAQGAGAEEIVTNRLSLSARFGLNLSARFKGVSGGPIIIPGNPRKTPSQPGRPNGDTYNYDDGYVLTDVSGNAGGQTWYWGYDSSASQISGSTILLSRTTPNGGASATSSFDNDPQLGAELTYNRLLGVARNARYGIEVAANYLNVSLHNTMNVAGSATRVTDAYPFTPGTTPPNATPPNTSPGPYQGSFEGPGFLIGDVPVGSTSVAVPGAVVMDRRRFDADLWGFRIGPYLEVPLNDRVNLAFSAGLAVGLLNANVSWSQTVGGVGPSGGGNDFDVLWGGYAGATVSCRIDEHWSVLGGGQYQSLGTYRRVFSGREVEVDFKNSVFFNVGLSYSF